VFECLRAAAEGPIFPDWELHTLFGLTRSEVARIVAEWPPIEEDEDVSLAINNAMNSLLGYPHERDDVWPDYISGPREEVARVFAKWRGESVGGYFQAME
jgi:hypothetical protein